ncbi:MAG TPA: murein biosynthesis integral membrane protein MurJ [Candidatus Angelobacter sp.]|nr:murein biosynthesis integral membrane protein MurJ [Candidatus Angelobacter sp.]
MASVTVLVAVAGYLREATLAARFGISTTMDAYFAAIFIPTIFYLILIVGTLSPVFIPILIQEDPEKNPGKASLTFSVIANFTLLVFVIVVVCGVFGARFWLPWVFPGFQPSTSELAVRLIYIIFPALPFLALAGMLTALLNGFRRFLIAAFAPVVSSITVIAAAIFFHNERAIYAVGIATGIGFFLQCAVLLPASASLGIRYHPILNFRHPSIRKLLRLGIPLFLYLAVANTVTVLERNFASRISAGAISTLAYAFRLFTVPSNFFAAPLAIVAYPGFAQEALKNLRGDLAGQVSRLFRLLLFVFLPVTAWTMLNATPVTRILYEHGRFLPSDSWITSRILLIYSVGIVPNALAVVLLRCFFAIEDTVTPLLTELADLGLYAIAAMFLTRYFGIEGLATARGISFLIVFAILTFMLAKRKLLHFIGFGSFLLCIAGATAVMALVGWLVRQLLQPQFDSGGTLLRLVVISIELFSAIFIYLGITTMLRLGEARQIINTISGFVTGTRNRGLE